MDILVGAFFHYPTRPIVRGYVTLKEGNIWVVGSNIFLLFIPIWGNDPIWLIFFKLVETTN